MEIDPDHRLMRQVAQKDVAAYRQLVEKHLNISLRVAQRMLGNRQDAEDVMQEVCLKIWNEAPRWQPKAKFSTWLYRVVCNACIDRQRKVVRFASVDMDTIHDASESADESLGNRQQAAAVRDALQLLPDRQRAALVLSYYEEMSNEQAAEVLGLQLGAFQQLLFRARQKLKQELLTTYREQSNG